MSRVLSEAQLAVLRQQFFSQILGKELSAETANSLANAAKALDEAQQANNKAVEALDSALSALEAAQAAATPADVIAALSGYATKGYVDNQVDTKIADAFAGGETENVTVDGITLIFENGLYKGTL